MKTKRAAPWENHRTACSAITRYDSSKRVREESCPCRYGSHHRSCTVLVSTPHESKPNNSPQSNNPNPSTQNVDFNFSPTLGTSHPAVSTPPPFALHPTPPVRRASPTAHQSKYSRWRARQEAWLPRGMEDERRPSWPTGFGGGGQEAGGCGCGVGRMRAGGWCWVEEG